MIERAAKDAKLRRQNPAFRVDWNMDFPPDLNVGMRRRF